MQAGDKLTAVVVFVGLVLELNPGWYPCEPADVNQHLVAPSLTMTHALNFPTEEKHFVQLWRHRRSPSRCMPYSFIILNLDK